MPELPEVERFREILLSVVSETNPLQFDLFDESNLPRKWVSPADVQLNNNGKWRCKDVIRKGKQLCMVLVDAKGGKKSKSSSNNVGMYFCLHMGMTGRLISPTMSCSWGHKYLGTEEEKNDWPPKFTYLVLKSGAKEVAFADPRKFGGCGFLLPDEKNRNASILDELAPDALLETSTLEKRQLIVESSKISNQRLGIKALLLDQKRVVSGVGNWVADEVLYQCEIHPDQCYLSEDQSLNILAKLHSILAIAVNCLTKDIPYPDTWLFGYRWTKKKAGKDHLGRNLTFVTSGGRTSAIVTSIQKLKKCQGKVSRSVVVDPPKNLDKEALPLSTTNKKASKEVKEESVNNDELTSSSNNKSRKRHVRKTKAIPLSNKRIKKENDDTIITSDRNDNGEQQNNRKGTTSNSSTSSAGSEEEGNSSSYPEKSVSATTDSFSKKMKNKKSVKDRDKSKQKKEVFESILNQVDDTMKLDFREIGFAKWSNFWLPMIQLSPYDVEEGPIRDQWLNHFQNKKTRKRPRLVYWYGSGHEKPSFSFITSSIISMEEGCQRGYHEVPERIRKKAKDGKKLTKNEALLLEGLEEIMNESELSKEKRVGWLR